MGISRTSIATNMMTHFKMWVCSSQELGLSELTNAMIIDSGKTWGYNWDI